MNGALLLFFLSVSIFVLFGIIIYQQFTFRISTQRKLKEISQKLEEILDRDSGEKVMVFTDNQVLMDLAAQINRMLEDRQKMKADYRRAQLASKRMLSNISHDLKTPLTVIQGYLEIMHLQADSAQALLEKEMLDKTEQKAREVVELINQFFTLAKLEAGDTDMEIFQVNACEICRETVLDFYEILTQEKVQVQLAIPEEVVYVWGNKEALQRILANLISNVVRYGLDGKYLGIFLRLEEQYVCIDVVDKGKGIEKEATKHVFERLFMAEDSRSQVASGNGLGLTIAQNLAQQMGGEILLESEPSVKTVFTVKLKKFVRIRQEF